MIYNSCHLVCVLPLESTMKCKASVFCFLVALLNALVSFSNGLFGEDSLFVVQSLEDNFRVGERGRRY